MKEHSTQNIILAGIFAALTAASAFLQIPLGFTSITLQTAVTLLAGILLGPQYGALSQLVYVLLGLLGLPVFTKGGGIGYLLQPSMGFLLALVPAAYASGWVYEKTKKKKGNLLFTCLAAEVIIYAIGAPYMGLILNCSMGLDYSIAQIFKAGCLLYLPGDAVKCLVVILLAKPLKKALSQGR